MPPRTREPIVNRRPSETETLLVKDAYTRYADIIVPIYLSPDDNKRFYKPRAFLQAIARHWRVQPSDIESVMGSVGDEVAYNYIQPHIFGFSFNQFLFPLHGEVVIRMKEPVQSVWEYDYLQQWLGHRQEQRVLGYIQSRRTYLTVPQALRIARRGTGLGYDPELVSMISAYATSPSPNRSRSRSN